MCCGSKRTAWRYGSVPVAVARAGPEVVAPAVSGPFHAVMLHYTEANAIRLLGPVTGQAYAFSAAEPALAVDVRDAAVLTRGARFRRA